MVLETHGFAEKEMAKECTNIVLSRSKIKKQPDMKLEDLFSSMPKYAIFLFLITAFFTAVNFYEFAADKEPDGHVKGIAQLELARNYGVDAWGAMQKLMCKRMAFGSTVYSDVAVLDNGYATMPDLYPDIIPAEEGAMDAYDFAKAHDIEFLYVQACGKEEKDADLPFGVESSAGDKAARMTAFLNEQGVPNLSVREILESDGGDWYGYFYRTDHHMRNNAAFLIACEMGRKKKKKSGIETDADWIWQDDRPVLYGT